MDSPSWLSPVADVLSVIGFLVTVFVARRLSTIRKEFLLMGRAPKQADALQRNADRLTAFWSDTTANRLELVDVFSAVEVNLRSLRISVRRDLKRDCNRLYGDVREYQGLTRKVWSLKRNRTGAPELTHEQVRALYNGLTKMVDSVRQDIENQNWMR